MPATRLAVRACVFVFPTYAIGWMLYDEGGNMKTYSVEKKTFEDAREALLDWATRLGMEMCPVTQRTIEVVRPPYIPTIDV